MTPTQSSPWRNIAIVGPYLSGKTTLLESILSVTGAISRKGTVENGTTIGDNSPESQNRNMSVEVSAAYTQHGEVQFTFLDCPGSIEFAQETANALIGVGSAVIVCEPDVSRVLTLAPLFKLLDDWEIPHLLFINKVDRATSSFTEVLQALKTVSSRPLIPHQYPIRKGDEVSGFIDLVSEQAFQYHPGAPSDPIPLPEELKAEEQAARQEMLEGLADFDDRLLEELLEDIDPSQGEIIKDMKQELTADLIVPVFMGVATEDYGVRHLLDALAKETPEPAETAKRRGVKAASNEVIAQVLKTYYTAQGGKQSLVRVWNGTLTEGMTLNETRVGGVYRLMGADQKSVQTAEIGEIVALGRLDPVQTGDTLSSKGTLELPRAESLPPVYGLAIAPENRKDEVKVSGALTKLVEEDPALTWEQNRDTHEILLWGQGEIHLRVALDRLRRKYNLPMTGRPPKIQYKETVRQAVESVHGRYKHQSGGHGQFGDVYLDIAPLPRGEGFRFSETIVGGAVPKQYIPGVETGVREYLAQGPLGFPVVDVAVTLTNGSYHSVDSSEQAFKQAARVAMQTAMVQSQPTLLEPILLVEIYSPNESTSKVLQVISTHRGQILGYEGYEGWPGWDKISAYFPQAEMQDLIVELRSATMGVGSYRWQYDRLEPVPDKLAKRVLTQQEG
ncbi:elongation factor G [Geitlerinema sp. P-1104]|uniref:elongation factor G n=1 Tax=Geitlerinema sp. P-1104 TaxID=2546230 RepID=UPI001476D9D3|nr:elongation factor G [Geitlerinema sp. P-1104]NMG59614.1 elongation factor G [Geitlerinema sp. P-1104]